MEQSLPLKAGTFSMYRSLGYIIVTSSTVCSRQQCLIAEWLGLSVTVRVRAKARETLLKVTNTFVLHVNGSCNVNGICGERTTALHRL